MNDFTRDELVTIQELIVWGDEGYNEPSLRVLSIQKKIQQMIDNYCNHENLKNVSQDLSHRAPCWETGLRPCAKCEAIIRNYLNGEY